MDVLNLEFLRIAVAVIGVSAAAYQDYKTSFIDEKIVYFIMGMGLALNALAYFQANDLMLLYVLIGSFVIFVMGYLFYRKGQLGMGDVLLFVAIQMILPLAPASTHMLNPASFAFPSVEELPGENWFLIGYLNVFKYMLFFVTIFLLSSFLATLGSSFQYAMKLFSSKKRLRPNRMYAFASIFFVVLGTAILYYTFGLSLLTFLFFLLLIASAFFLTFKDQILDEIVIQRIGIKQIEDEDILAIEKMPQELVRKYGLEKVLTQKQIKILKEIEKKEKMKLFPVNKILPRFGPYILLALILALLFGNIIDMVMFFGARY
ncbi:MAG: prepilin peptidase [Candidatus Micrarchaeota archaeon]